MPSAMNSAASPKRPYRRLRPYLPSAVGPCFAVERYIDDHDSAAATARPRAARTLRVMPDAEGFAVGDLLRYPGRESSRAAGNVAGMRDELGGDSCRASCYASVLNPCPAARPSPGREHTGVVGPRRPGSSPGASPG